MHKLPSLIWAALKPGRLLSIGLNIPQPFSDVDKQSNSELFAYGGNFLVLFVLDKALCALDHIHRYRIAQLYIGLAGKTQFELYIPS